MSTMLPSPPTPPAAPPHAPSPLLPALPHRELEPAHAQDIDSPWSHGRRWAATVLALVVALCAPIIVFNVVVDPSGRLGTGRFDGMTQLALDRRAKVQLLDTQNPATVVLGTSRSKMLDPALVAPAHARQPVNAALVGGDVFEERVLAEWLATRAARDPSHPMPHLFVGVDVEGFRGRSLRSSGLLAVPQVRDIARRDAGQESWMSLAPEFLDLTLGLDVTRASWRTMRAQRAANRTRVLHAEDKTKDVSDFTRRGIPHLAHRWFVPTRRAALIARAQAAFEPSLERYRGRYRDIGTRPDPASVADLRALVRAANDAGDRPVLFLTATHPTFARALAPLGRTQRVAAVRQLLERMQDAGHITFVDCSTCVPADAAYWLDAVHPSPLGAAFIARRLRSAAQRDTR